VEHPWGHFVREQSASLGSQFLEGDAVRHVEKKVQNLHLCPEPLIVFLGFRRRREMRLQEFSDMQRDRCHRFAEIPDALLLSKDRSHLFRGECLGLLPEEAIKEFDERLLEGTR
jgi:hypothetical protein